MYKINELEFKTKKDLTDYCRRLVERNKYKKIEGDDFKFIHTLITTWHDNPDMKLCNLDHITVKHHKEMYNTLSIFIIKKDGTTDDVSWNNCVKNAKKN